MIIDFYKKFNLVDPVVGLVQRITSPKGVRKEESYGEFSYHFHTDLDVLYDGSAVDLKDGIYWVMDVCKKGWDGDLCWNHYLFIIKGDQARPIAEFLDKHDTKWVKDALPYVKRYFAGDIPEAAILRYFPKPVKKSGWAKTKK